MTITFYREDGSGFLDRSGIHVSKIHVTRHDTIKYLRSSGLILQEVVVISYRRLQESMGPIVPLILEP